MTNEELQEQLNRQKAELDELRQLFYKGKFSNMDVFQGKVKVNGGLIMNTSSTTLTYDGQEGETAIYNNGTDKQICTFLSGSWICQDYAQETGLENIVEDTTPQLGGELDTNDKAISSESGAIEIYTMSKTILETEENYEDLFSITLNSAGALWAEIDFAYGVTTTGSAGAIKFGHQELHLISDASSFSASGLALHLDSGGNSGMDGIPGFWTSAVTDNKTMTVSLQQNNDLDASVNFVARIKIYSTTSNFVFTEL